MQIFAYIYYTLALSGGLTVYTPTGAGLSNTKASFRYECDIQTKL